MTKKIVILWLVVIMVFSLAACGKGLKQGKYVTDDEMSSVTLLDNNEFVFDRHIATSYAPAENYSIKNGKLILHVYDDEEYIFEIKNGQIIFKSGDMAEALVTPGTVFKFVKNN